MDSRIARSRPVVMALQGAALFICALTVFHGRYPPAQAQEFAPLAQPIAAEDQRQDDTLRDLLIDQDHARQSMQRERDAISALQVDVATLKGQQGSWTLQSGSIGGMLLASLGFQAAPYVRRKRRGSSS